jgi:hypothetical protein
VTRRSRRSAPQPPVWPGHALLCHEACSCCLDPSCGAGAAESWPDKGRRRDLLYLCLPVPLPDVVLGVAQKCGVSAAFGADPACCCAASEAWLRVSRPWASGRPDSLVHTRGLTPRGLSETPAA